MKEFSLATVGWLGKVGKSNGGGGCCFCCQSYAKQIGKGQLTLAQRKKERK